MADQQLKIDLTAKDKTAAAFRALNNRLAATRSAAMAVGGAIGKVTLAASALGAGFAVATKKALSFADNIAKTADKVGISTTALQKYRYAADLAGVSSQELDNALRKLQQSAGEATTKGTGAAFDAFNQLGLGADLAAGKLEDGEVRFRAVVQALEKVENQSQKAALAAAVFGGRMGPQLVNLLNQGIAGLDKTGKRAEELGLIISEELTRNSEKAIDTITELQTTLKTKLVATLVEAAPAINEFGQELLNNLPNIISRMRELAQVFGLIGVTATDKINALNEEILELAKKLTVYDEIRAKGRELTVQQANRELRTLQMIEQKQLAINALTVARNKSLSAAGVGTGTGTDTGAEGGGTNIASKIEEDLRNRIIQSQLRSRQIAETQVEYMYASNLQRERALKLEQIMAQLDQAKVQLSKSQMKLLMEDLDREFELKAILEEKLKVDEERNKAAERQKELQQQIADIMQDGIRTANEAISGLISGTMKWKDALGLVLNKVLDIVTQMGKTKSGGFSLDQLFKLGGSFLTSMFGAPANPSANMSGPELYYHTGGMVNRKSGMGFRSDERMIVARTGERVLNRGQSMMAGADGGVTLNQTINLTTGIQQTVRAEVMSMAPQIAAQAKAAVLDAKRRGGGFSAAFA